MHSLSLENNTMRRRGSLFCAHRSIAFITWVILRICTAADDSDLPVPPPLAVCVFGPREQAGVGVQNSHRLGENVRAVQWVFWLGGDGTRRRAVQNNSGRMSSFSFFPSFLGAVVRLDWRCETTARQKQLQLQELLEPVVVLQVCWK